jgi:hypothetical protein
MSGALRDESAAVAGAAIYRALSGSPTVLSEGLSLGEIQGLLSEYDSDRLDDIMWALVESGLIIHNGGIFHTAAPSDGA